MQTSAWISLTALLCFAGVIVFFLNERGQKTEAEEQVASADSVSATPPQEQAEEKTSSDEPELRITPLADGRALLDVAVAKSQELHQFSPEQDLEVISELFGHYHFIFRENPTGSENREFTNQLLGQNAQKLVFIDPQHPSLSPDGELLDPWGSPYLFHTLSTQAIEIRSIGPDQMPWTEDDLTLDFEKIEPSLQL